MADKNAELMDFLHRLAGGDEVEGVADRAAYFLNKNVREPLGAPPIAYKGREGDYVEVNLPGSSERIKIARNAVSDQDWEDYKAYAAKGDGVSGSTIVESGPRAAPPKPNERVARVDSKGEPVAPIVLPGKSFYPDEPPAQEKPSGSGGGGFWGAAQRALMATVTQATPVTDRKDESWGAGMKRQAAEANAAQGEPLVTFGRPDPVDDRTLRAAERVFQRANIPPAAEGVDGYDTQDLEALARSGGREFAPDSRLSGAQRETLIDRVAPGQSLRSPEALKAERGAVSPDEVVLSPSPDAPPGTALAGLSFAAKIPGAGVGPSALDGVEKRMDDTAAQQAEALRTQAGLEGERLDATAKLQQKGIDDSLAGQKRIQQTMELRRAAVDDVQRSYEKTIARMNDPSEVVDPNRFWNSRTTGQKVLAAISIMLGGMGQGTFAAMGLKPDNGALDIIRDAIKQDLEVQQTNIENRRGQLKDIASGQRELFNMFRQTGMDEIESLRSEEAAKIDLVQRQIEQLATQMGSPEAKQKAELAIATLDQEKNKIFAQIGQHRDSFALGKAELAMKKYIAEIKLAKGPGAGQPIRGAQAVELADIKTAHDQITALEKRFAGVSGIFNKAKGGIPTTEANKYNAEAKLAMRKIALKIDQSVLQKHDIEDWEKWWPFAGDLNGKGKLELIKTMLRESYNNRVQTYGATGFNTGTLSPLEGGAPAGAGGGDFSDLGFEE
jgi:hypothetical protein